MIFFPEKYPRQLSEVEEIRFLNRKVKTLKNTVKLDLSNPSQIREILTDCGPVQDLKLVLS